MRYNFGNSRAAIAFPTCSTRQRSIENDLVYTARHKLITKCSDDPVGIRSHREPKVVGSKSGSDSRQFEKNMFEVKLTCFLEKQQIFYSKNLKFIYDCKAN